MGSNAHCGREEKAQQRQKENSELGLAERVGFEPTDGVNHHLISNQAPSATQTPLRVPYLFHELVECASTADLIENSVGTRPLGEAGNGSGAIVGIFLQGDLVAAGMKVATHMGEPGSAVFSC